jgi:AcrR family transcriptional regulator
MAPDRKNEILAAARDCFDKFGYDKTTLDDIGEAVGMNKVSLYYYFKNKEAIFTEAVIREADEYSDSLAKKVESIDGCRNKILAWIREGFRYNRANSILHHLSPENLRKLGPQLEELKSYGMRKGIDYFETLLKNGQEKKEITKCDTGKVASAIQNVIYSMKNQAYQNARYGGRKEFDFNAMVSEIVFTVSLMLDGIEN